MVVMLLAYRTYDGGLVLPPSVVETWPKDTTFPFDIGDPNAWHRWLSFEYKGGLLARKDKNGNPLVYKAYNWGGGYVHFFPPKGYKLVQYGKLLPPRRKQ